MLVVLTESRTKLLRSVASVLLASLLVFTSGCGEREIAERELPKGIERIADTQGDANGSSSEQAGPSVGEAGSGGDPRWSVPESWRRVEEEAPMRFATFVTDHPEGRAKVLVSRFTGEVGGELANVNRWRKQLGLGPIDHEQLDATVSRFGESGRSGYRVRIRGGGSILIAAGLHEAERNRTWFVKSVVSTPTVADRLEQEMVAFASSIGREAQPEAETE